MLVFQLRDHSRLRKITAFAVGNRNPEDLALPACVGERGVGGFNTHEHMFADKFQPFVANQSTGQQLRFTENLKPVADADDQAASFGVGGDSLHGR